MSHKYSPPSGNKGKFEYLLLLNHLVARPQNIDARLPQAIKLALMPVGEKVNYISDANKHI